MRVKNIGGRIRSATGLVVLAITATACPVDPPPPAQPQDPIVPPAPFAGPDNYNTNLLEEGDVVAFHGKSGDSSPIAWWFTGLTLVTPDGVTEFGWEETYGAVVGSDDYGPNETISDVFGATDPTSDRRFRHTPIPGTDNTLHELIEGPDGAETVLWSYQTTVLGGNEGGGPAWYLPTKQFSPDGRFITSVGYPPSWFGVADADTGDNLFSASGDFETSPVSQPNWSADGNHLFYTAYAGEFDDVYTYTPTNYAVDFTTGTPVATEIPQPDLSLYESEVGPVSCAVRGWSDDDRLAWSCGAAGKQVQSFTSYFALTSDLQAKNLNVYYEPLEDWPNFTSYMLPKFLSNGRVAMLRYEHSSDTPAAFQIILFDDSDRSVIGSLAAPNVSPGDLLGLSLFIHPSPTY